MTEAITMTVTLSPKTIMNIVEESSYGVTDNFSDEALQLGGATRKELVIALANDPKIRKMIAEELEFRVNDAVESIYLGEGDLEGTAIAEQIMDAFTPIQAMFDSINERDDVTQAIALLKSKGYSVTA